MTAKQKNEKSIFKAAMELKTPPERIAYVEKVCASDPALKERISALLKAREQKGDFLEALLDEPLVSVNEQPLEEKPGTVIGRYKLLEQIGEGGMAVVYMAEQAEPIRRKVALKIIKLGMDTRSVITRFEAERQALAMMDHPNIAKVLDAGATETGRPYFVMELVKGASITDFCDANNLSTHERLKLFVQVCQAVQHAHQKGIIHRDIKPTNVMVTLLDGEPVPKVIDFGIAKAINRRLTEKTLFTRYAQIIGTPPYMSPEQAEMSGLDIDIRTDIFSLGTLLYELLTGSPPFTSEYLLSKSYEEMQRIIREEEPTRPSTKISTLDQARIDVARYRNTNPEALHKLIRDDLDWVVMKTLEKDRDRRYDSVSEFATDIKRYLDNEPVLAGPPSTVYRIKKFVQRRHGLVTATIAVIAALMIGLIVSSVMYFRAEYALRREAAAHTEAQTVTDFLTNELLASVYPEKAKGQEVTVRYILEAASDNLESMFETRPLTEAKIRHTLGLTYDKMGDYEAADVHLTRALGIRTEQLGEDDPSTLAIIDDIGWLRCSQGQYEQSESLLSKAYEGRRQILGDEHPDTIESLSNLGAQYMIQAQFQKGMKLSEKAFEMASRILGDKHPVTLHSRTAIALEYNIAAEFNAARLLASEGFDISRRILGDEHKTTLDMLNQFVWASLEMDHIEKSRILAPEALAISQRVFGEEHLTTMTAMNNLGQLYLMQGKLDKAELLLTRSVELSERILGKFHGYRALMLIRLTRLHGKRGQYEKKLELLIQALGISRQTHGPYHPVTGYIENLLVQRKRKLIDDGIEYFNAGNYQEALATFIEADKIHRALYRQPNPSETAFMARSLYLLGREGESRDILDRLRMMYEHGTNAHEESHLYGIEQLLNQNDVQVVEVWTLLEAGELEKASAAVKDLLARTVIDNPVATANVTSITKALARAYCLQGKRAEFDGMYEQANSRYQSAFQMCPDYALPLCRLARLQATCPQSTVRNGENAVRLATDACVLAEWKNPEYVDALAAAYAETGDYAMAVEYEQTAIDLLDQEAHEGIYANYEHRRRLYKVQTPFRVRHRGTIIAWWKFDEVVDGKILDASGNGHHGELIGDARIIADPQRKHVLCLTGGGYVDCGNPAAFNITGPITITAWIKLDAPATRCQRLIGNGAWNIFRYYDSHGGQTNLGFICNGLECPDDYSWSIRGKTDMEIGIWHHIVGVNDGMKMSIYIDGKLDVSRGVRGALYIHDWPLYIGSNSRISSRKWQGLIDDVRIYDYGLSEAEIEALYVGNDSEIQRY